jgi:predicted dehydrogenase
MKKYKVGIIGYGGFGQFLHYWWDKLENVEVVAIADPHTLLDSSENFKVYRYWKDLVDDPQIDIVSVVTPPSFHAEMACAAMKANKHVLLEKPVATTDEDGQQILNTQKETGMVITVDHMIRYNPIIQSLKQIGQSGAFGKLRHAVVNNYAQDAALPADHWFWNEELSGGIFVEHGVHFFDIINGISAQQYIEVCGSSHRRNASQRDQVSAMVTYKEGLIASYYHDFSGPGFFEQTNIHLAYDLARIEIEGWMPMKGTIKAMVNEQSKEQLKSIPGWTITKANALDNIRDVSRPEGWGGTDEPTLADGPTYCGGIPYQVNEMLLGTFEINQTKGQVYGKCVQSVLTDMIKKIENKDHALTITIEDGYEALKMGLLATK